MSTVSGANQANKPGQAHVNEEYSPPSQAELKQGIVDVYNKLFKTHKTVADLDASQLTEDLIYAGHALADLRKTNPRLANNMLEGLRADYRGNVKEKERQPLFRAVDEFLGEAVKKGKLTPHRRKEVTREAFGHAQLDNKTSGLGRQNYDLATDGKSNIDAVLEKAASGTRATLQQMREFRTRINSDKAVNPERYKLGNQALKNSIGTAPSVSAPPKSEPKPPANEAPKTEAPTPGFNPSELKPFDERTTGPDALVTVPESRQTGNFAVYIPLVYSDQIAGVNIVDDQGTVLDELKHLGKNEDGRQSFGSGLAGSKYPDNAKVVLIFNDSTHTTPEFGSLNQVNKKLY